MALESGTYIDSLNASNPVATDGLAQADDHMRLIKSTILASFPSITGAVNATHTEINTLGWRYHCHFNHIGRCRPSSSQRQHHGSGSTLRFQNLHDLTSNITTINGLT